MFGHHRSQVFAQSGRIEAERQANAIWIAWLLFEHLPPDRLAPMDSLSAPPATASALDAFRALVMADAPLAQALAEPETLDDFIPLAIARAAEAGIALDEAELRAAARPDPLGLDRLSGAPLTGTRWPPSAWLPGYVVSLGGELAIDWIHFAGERFTGPFFEEALRRAGARPFNALFRYRMTAADFVANAEPEGSLAPGGLVFHMSRCGSTLATQMLAVLPDMVALSEPAPLDALVLFAATRNELDAGWRVAAVRAMVAALGRRRSGEERRYVLKLDTWHILALPLFRRAFPAVPWAFLHRDPVEVMVSQMRMRGIQTMPELMPPGLYGLQPHQVAGQPEEEVCAYVLGMFCRAAADNLADGGIAIAYPDVAEAVTTRLAPHFGFDLDAAEQAAMAAATRRDAKQPDRTFTADATAKQREASDALRAAAARHMAEPCARLSAASSPR
jgi:hypothetical protein